MGGMLDCGCSWCGDDDTVITLEHVDTEEQITDIFTKALDANQFEKLRGKLGICLLEDL